MRNLASIKTITDIVPIDGRDRIVLAAVDGWSVIVKKDEFRVGDKCVYIEIDSVLPEKAEFEFLRKNNFRIKTMKMAGVISQGICFPLSILPYKRNGDDYEVNEDVTDIIGVKQYERTMDTGTVDTGGKLNKFKYPKWLMRNAWFRSLVSKTKDNNSFPSFIKKTDETRIQNMPFILKDKSEWIVTEKIDGQSGTFCLVRHKSIIPFVKDKYEYIVCSRNLRLKEKDSSSYWKVSDKYQIENALKNMIGDRDWIAIQGECIAPNVQGNKYKVEDADLYVFNLIYPTGRLDSITAKSICNNHGIKFVPIVAENYILPDSVNSVLEYANGKSMIYNTLREGLVFRSKDGEKSFKAVDPIFLMNHDE